MRDIESLLPPGEIVQQIDRLRKITGFITILHDPDNTRVEIFARYYHVRRVVWLSKFIADKNIELGVNIDVRKVLLLAWSHDLNRWPFSHNSEKDIYIQEEDLKRYLRANHLDNMIVHSKDLEGIIAKDFTDLSYEARIVLFADIVTGFIEDPLWITTALNVTWRIIPKSVSEYLGIPLDDPKFLEKLYEFNILFEKAKSHLPLVETFDTLFQERAKSYLIKHNYVTNFPLGTQEFEEYRMLIKEEFMRKVIFAYNNEKISQGSMLKSKLILPFLKTIDEKNTNELLTTIDEEQFINAVINSNIITREEIVSILPRLNYIEEYEPEMSFRTNYMKYIKL